MTPERIAELRALAGAAVWWTNAAPVVGECLDEIERLLAVLTRIRAEWPRCNGHPACRNEPAGAVVCETCGERWSERALDVIDTALNGGE